MSARTSTRFRLAVFDVAGTTVLDGDAVLECLKAVLSRQIHVTSQDVRDVMGLPKPLAIRQLLSARGSLSGDGLNEAVVEAHEAFRSELIARYTSDGALAPAPGALKVFSRLQNVGVRVVLDTGFSRDILDAVLAQLDWAEGTTIDFSIASDEVEHGRPYPDIIHRAMALSQVTDASLVVKVGDTPADMMQGLAARCGLVVGVTYGTHTRMQLERLGVKTIDRLLDLPPLLGLETV